ncbi:PH domain-containing protein [Actinomadura sp. DC4]|uniref:PH domain-containing protein n=1 Tax=Actinomadura sp. DC4 TaxID=3055069 RepID=UPI0025B1E979|nr:PH domain-containing protein [Actinomadura sp. DC4]MDN3353327.1 PH domain-containing protein [Actinomadura sp. DC4]
MTTGADGWRRLSTRMLVIHPIQELLRAWPVLIGLVFAGTAGGHGSWWSLAGAGFVVVAGMLRWFTTTYRVSAEQIQVRKGLVRRQLLTVPRDRIRTVDVTANALHRSLGLAKVEVGTGRTDRKDDAVKLDALHAGEATRLREELLHRSPERAAEPRLPRESLIVSVPPAWVRYGPFTLTGLVTVGVVAGVAGRAVNEAHIDPGRLGPVSTLLDRWEHAALPVEIGVFAAALLVAVALASTLGYVLAFYGFRLTRNTAGTLHVTRGLITTRSITIEERRLRGVEISEPLLLRAVRGARCLAITTGLRVGRGAERGGSLLLPPAPRAEAERVAALVLGRTTPLTCPLTPHGPRATGRRYTRAVGLAALIAAACLVLSGLDVLPAWTWHVAPVLLVIAALLAYDRTRSLGHALVERTLVSRRGSLVRRRAVLSCDGIIGWNLRRSFFQRRAGLATLVATTAAGRQRIDVQDVPLDEALRVADAALPGLLTPFLEG